MRYIWIIFLLIVILYSSFGDEKCMHNVLDGECIDVSSYIDEGYKPINCELDTTSVCALLKPGNTLLNPTQVKKVSKELFKAYGSRIDLQNYKISYEYSYIITYDLVDVYVIMAELDGQRRKIFFRKQSENLIFPFKEDEGW